MSGLLGRIEWVLAHRKDRVRNPSHWSLGARREDGRPLPRTTVNTMVTRLRENPDYERDIGVGTLDALADFAEVSRVWFAHGRGAPDGGPTVERSYRYESLQRVVEHPSNHGRWSDEAIAAVCSKALKADVDPGEEYWTEELDRFHQALKLADRPFPKLPARGAGPLDDIDERPVQPARKKR